MEEQSTQGKKRGQVKTRGTILKGWFIRKLRWGNKGQGKQLEVRADKACHGAQSGKTDLEQTVRDVLGARGLSRLDVGGVRGKHLPGKAAALSNVN